MNFHVIIEFYWKLIIIHLWYQMISKLKKEFLILISFDDM